MHFTGTTRGIDEELKMARESSDKFPRLSKLTAFRASNSKKKKKNDDWKLVPGRANRQDRNHE